MHVYALSLSTQIIVRVTATFVMPSACYSLYHTRTAKHNAIAMAFVPVAYNTYRRSSRYHGQTNLRNPTMHLFHIPQCTIQNRNVHISVLDGALCDMEQMHNGICELFQFNDHIIITYIMINSLSPEISGCDFRNAIFTADLLIGNITWPYWW